MRSIRAATVQFQHIAGDKRANLETIVSFAEIAAGRDVSILAFPEMCVTGYWHVRRLDRNAIYELSEKIPDGPSTQLLLQLSGKLNMTIGAGLIERGEDGRLYNSYSVAMPNGDVACHRKLHCFISEHMSSGTDYTVFDTPHGWRLGVLTCYDNNIIENARIVALRGAEILLAPHQTGGCASRSPRAMGRIDVDLWESRERDPGAIEEAFRGPKGRGWLMRWLPSRAHDNGLYILFSNGVGRDDDEVRTGNAMILDPYGEILAETWKAGDDMVLADLTSETQATSSGRRWLAARRPECYGDLTEPTGRETDIRNIRFGLNQS
jgi:predicted amidohydrolase